MTSRPALASGRLARGAWARDGHEGEDGSALVTVLVLVAVVTTLVGVVLALYVVQHRLVTRDLRAVQAGYAAEAGVHAALARVHADPKWRSLGDSLALPGAGLSVDHPARTHLAGEGRAGDDASGAVGSSESVLLEASRVWVRAYGGYWEVRADARSGRAARSVRALVGLASSGGYWAGAGGASTGNRQNPFDHALVVGDTLTPVTLAGEVEVVGDVLTGRRGARTNSLRGRPFRGRFEGRVVREGVSLLPSFDPALFDETLARHRAYLGALPADLPETPVPWVLDGAATPRPSAARRGAPLGVQARHPDVEAALVAERAFRDGLVTYGAAGEVALGPADQDLFTGPALVVVRGGLAVEGPLALTPGTQLVASGTVRIGAGVTGEGLLVSGARVEVAGARIQGQLLARETAAVAGGARLRYPSVLYVAGEAGGLVGATAGGSSATGGRPPARPSPYALRLGRAELEGVVLYAAEAAAAGMGSGAGRVLVDEGAVVRGALVSLGQTELRGTVEGTLATRQTYFYEAPAAYVNWLHRGRLARAARPDPLVVPVGLGPAGGRPLSGIALLERGGLPPYRLLTYEEVAVPPEDNGALAAGGPGRGLAAESNRGAR